MNPPDKVLEVFKIGGLFQVAASQIRIMTVGHFEKSLHFRELLIGEVRPLLGLCEGIKTFDRTFFIWAAITVPTTLIGARIGLMLYRKVDDAQFRWIVLALLTLSGLTLIVSSLR